MPFPSVSLFFPKNRCSGFVHPGDFLHGLEAFSGCGKGVGARKSRKDAAVHVFTHLHGNEVHQKPAFFGAIETQVGEEVVPPQALLQTFKGGASSAHPGNPLPEFARPGADCWGGVVAPDGAIWVGSAGCQGGPEGGTGLYRFDGQTWTTFLPGHVVRSLDIGPDGSVWVDATRMVGDLAVNDTSGLYVITPEAAASMD